MEWKKSNISSSELEQKQQAYIKEALEMAKRSLSIREEKMSAEKAAAEKAAAAKAAAEKAAAEKAAAEKAAAEKAAAEKAAAEKAAAEKAAAEKAAAEKAAAEKAAAEKAAAEKAIAEELTKFSKKEEEICKTDFDKGESLCENPEPSSVFRTLTANQPSEEEKCDENERDSTAEKSEKNEKGSCGQINDNNACDEDGIIDIAARKKQQEAAAQQRPNSPANFNQYINQHNQARCNCPSCQRKRAGQ